MHLGDYTDLFNPHHLGRGSVYFGPALRPDGGINTEGYDHRWGDNWPQPVGGRLVPPGRFVGNARDLVLQPSVRRLATSAWDIRGNLVVEGVQASVTLYGHGVRNLADAMHARVSSQSSRPVDETISISRANVEAGSMLFVRHAVDVLQPVTVSPSWTTWQEDVHWRRRPFGIELLLGVYGPIGSSIQISYTPEGDARAMEALTNPGLELGLFYAGINKVSRQPILAHCYRCQPQLESALQPLGDTINTLTLQFTLKPVRLPGTRAAWYRMQAGRYPVTH